MSSNVHSLLTLTERIIFLVLLGLFGLQALRTYLRRFALIGQGKKVGVPAEGLSTRLGRFIAFVPGQYSNLRTVSAKDIGGAAHFVLFWCLILFGLYFLLFLILGDGFGILGSFLQSGAATGLASLADLLGIILGATLVFGLVRRAILRPARLGPDYEVSLFLFVTIAGTALLVCFYLLAAMRFNLGGASQSPPIAGAIAEMLGTDADSLATQSSMFHTFWWLQAAIICVFLLYVPFSDHQHALFAPLNIFSGRIAAKPGIFSAPIMDKNYHGLDDLHAFTGKQLLELYGCAQCGRCQEVCPAVAAGKSLSPKKVINDLRIWMDDTGKIHPFWKGTKEQPAGDSPAARIADDEIWSCNTCMACAEVCPALVSSMDKIVDLRRDRVLARAEMYPEVADLFRNLENYGDSFGMGLAHRESWALGQQAKSLADGDECEYLFWVGCQASFGDRAKSSAINLTRLLSDCGISVGILGREEYCCGDPLRRLGNEYQFAKFAKRNIESLQKRSFTKIIAYCPHCYNVLKNEYPQFGGNFEVVHYTEVLEDLVKKGKLQFKESTAARVAYHDPCYLARGNDITSGNRVVSSMPGMQLQSLPQSGRDTFCCGGGGGAMWMRDTGTTKINVIRAQQLNTIEPDVVVSSCPYCMIMLEDGVRSLGDATIKCKDLLELVAETATTSEGRS